MNNDDKKLKLFLSRNRPEPRAAPADEADRIWAKIQQTNKQPRLPQTFGTFLRGTSIAAAMALVLILARGPIGTPEDQANAAVVSDTLSLILGTGDIDGADGVLALAAVLGDE